VVAHWRTAWTAAASAGCPYTSRTHEPLESTRRQRDFAVSPLSGEAGIQNATAVSLPGSRCPGWSVEGSQLKPMRTRIARRGIRIAWVHERTTATIDAV